MVSWLLNGKNYTSANGLDYNGEIIGYEKRGLLLSPSLNYSNSEELFSTLTLNGGWINDQGDAGIDSRGQTIDKSRGFAQFRSIYAQQGNFRLASQLDWESDSDFLREFKQDNFDQSQWSQGFSEFNYQGNFFFLVSAYVKGQIKPSSGTGGISTTDFN